MNNPYDAPKAELREGSAETSKAWDITHRVITLVVAVACCVQLAAMLIFIFKQMWPIDPAYRTILIWKLSLPAMLALCGILLLCRSRFAFYGFAAYFAIATYWNAWDSRVMSFAFLAYAFHLWQTRWLR